MTNPSTAYARTTASLDRPPCDRASRRIPRYSCQSRGERRLSPSSRFQPGIDGNLREIAEHVTLRETIQRWNSPPKLLLVDPEPGVEVPCLDSVPPQNLPRAGRGRDRRPGRLDTPAQVAQPSLRGALVRLPRVVGKAARDLLKGEAPGWGRNLPRKIPIVKSRGAERSALFRRVSPQNRDHYSTIP